MAGSTGALNLLVCLAVMRQPDFQTWTAPACLSARVLGKTAPSDVCFPLSCFSEPVFPSWAVFLLFMSAARPVLGSLWHILTQFGAWSLSELLKMFWCAEPSDCEYCFILFPSSSHPLRTIRAAMRKESVWLCGFSRRADSGGLDVADFVPQSKHRCSGLRLRSIPLLFQVTTSAAAIQKAPMYQNTEYNFQTQYDFILITQALCRSR